MQDYTLHYGDNVNVSEVMELSPQVYKECLLKENIFPPHISFYKDGEYQFNVAHFHRKTIVATDAKEYQYLLLQRVEHKFLRTIVYRWNSRYNSFLWDDF